MSTTGMNRHARRAAAPQLKRENSSWPRQLVNVPEEMWPPAQGRTKPLAVMRSRTHLVQVYAAADPGVICRLSVCTTEVIKDGNWRDEVTWDELQEIKRQAGYGGNAAVEIYPPDGLLVNVANMRHVWVLKAVPAFMWGANGEGSSDG